MSNQLLSPHWYRIEAVKLSLPNHVRIHQHQYRKTLWFVLCDEISGKHHRYNQASYNFIRLIDGKRTVDEIWHKMNEDLGDDAPTQDEILRLLGTLHLANLLHTDQVVDIQQLIDRKQQQRKQIFKSKYGNPLSLRFPLLDPDKFLRRYMHYASPMFTRVAGLITLFIILYATLLMLKNWNELMTHAMENALSPYNLFLMWLVYPVIKLLHELGHGFAVKRWGGQVHEMGIMLLVFMPVPYVDASAASSFRSKYQRMFVGAAGIIVELLIASIALIIWLNVRQGMLSDTLFNIMLISGVSTLLFNGNPLLKFDGYFVLSDFLEIPGLAARANKYYAYVLQKHVFKVKGLESPVMAYGEGFWFLVYAPAAFIYRLFLIVSIALFVAGQYFFVGIALAVWAVYMQAIMPIVKSVSFLFSSPVLMHRRGRAISVIASVIAALALFVFIIPMPLNTLTEGVVWMPDKSQLRASTNGFVEQVLVKHGEQVMKGKPLIVTRDPLIKARLELLKAQYRELSIEYIELVKQDVVQAGIMKEEMNLVQGRIALLEEQIAELIMKSPHDGIFVMPGSSEMQGYFVKQGDPIAYIINYGKVNIRVVVPQNSIGLVRQKIENVEIRFINKLDKVYRTKVSREIPAATYQLPSRALSQKGGGKIPTAPYDDNGVTTDEQYFQFELSLPEDAKLSYVGQRVIVKFLHGYEPLVIQWYRSIEALLLNEQSKV